MKNLIISITRALLSKNIAFCIYRFPDDSVLHIAIDPAYLPHEKETSFWIAPFVPQSKAPEIILDVVKEEFLGNDFLKQINSLPDRKTTFNSLPVETSKEEYFQKMDTFLNDIRSKKLEKAILSRVFNVEKPIDFDPLACFEQLANEYQSTFVHLFFHPQSGMWMGATPELLLMKNGTEYETMTLAGTQSRKPLQDYHWREKEIEEHQIVGRHIEEVFERNGLLIQKKQGFKTIESGKVAHLRTDYVFRETTPVPIRKLLSELHPTPAVGGLPVDKGVDYILAYEGYDRKYYCGFIGETDFLGKARLYTNLRCMQIGTEKIAIFVGGGITAASDPQEEWEEIIMKSKTMLEKIKPVKELH